MLNKRLFRQRIYFFPFVEGYFLYRQILIKNNLQDLTRPKALSIFILLIYTNYWNNILIDQHIKINNDK